MKTLMAISLLFFTLTAYSQQGLWSSKEELLQIPINTNAWAAVKTAADSYFSQPNLSDNNSNDDVNCLAAAIVYARTGDDTYKQRVIAALEFNVRRGNPGLGENGIVSWCRNVGAYALAADLVDYRNEAFELWLRNMVEEYRDLNNHNNTIEEIFYRRPNNWGTMAFGTLCAVYGYLNDTAKLAKIRTYIIQLIKGPNPGATYGKDISWHVDENNLRLINPKGSVKNGLNIDGIIPDDMRRNGVFSNPPPNAVTSYHWEVLQGLIVGARILNRYNPDLSIWHVDNDAINRAVKILEVDWRRDFNNDSSNWAAIGDDTWLLPFIDEAYGTSYSSNAFDPSRLWDHGKNAGWPYVVNSPLARISRYSEISLDVKIFPNPIKNTTQIEIVSSGTSKLMNICIYNLKGEMIAKRQLGNLKLGVNLISWKGLNFNFIQPGAYVINILDNDIVVSSQKILLLN